MNEIINSTKPIEVFYERINDCVEYDRDIQVAFTLDQIIQTSHDAIIVCVYYTDACKEWRKKPLVDKSWNTFKTFFSAKYHELKEHQKVTTSQTNFHGGNAAYDITQDLDNLSSVAMNDHNNVLENTTAYGKLINTNKKRGRSKSKS